MGQFEKALLSLEDDIVGAQKSADQLSKALRQLLTGARAGNIQQIDRGLSLMAALGAQAAEAAASLPGRWQFDARAYLENGYIEELRSEAASAEVQLFERDGRIYAFPVVLRILPAETALRLSQVTERGLRPKEVVRKLKASQTRPQRLTEQRFLDMVYRAYQRLAGNEWRMTEQGPGPLVLLNDIHEVVTLLPGTDYTLEEFARDLLLLDRQPSLRTRDGHSFRFSGSTLGRSAKKIVVFDEAGNAREFIAVTFVRES